MDYTEVYEVSRIIGSLVAGVVVGAVPAVCGAVKRKIGLAVGGFFACVVAAFVLGLILAVPVCGLFVFLIFKKPKAAATPSSTAILSSIAIPSSIITLSRTTILNSKYKRKKEADLCLSKSAS